MHPSIDVKTPLAGPKGSTKWLSRRSSLTDDYTRTELRKLGLDHSSTQFPRWEAAGKLTPVKPSGSPASRVRYWGWNVKGFAPHSFAGRGMTSPEPRGKIPTRGGSVGIFLFLLTLGGLGFDRHRYRFDLR